MVLLTLNGLVRAARGALRRSADIRDGRPRIAGTGVTVRRIAWWYKQGLSPEEIADQFEHVTFAQIYAALAYYHANREEIEADLEREETEAEALKRQHSQTYP